MKITQGLKLHNRFDITVTDIRTGEVRQVAEAENVVTDYAHEQIAQMNTHWYRLFIGGGSGTPAVTDVSMFDYIGYAQHSNAFEYVEDYEQNMYYRKREYLLYPEDFVGETITEVGLSCGSAANTLATHAMIKDAEGNPISITKGEFDQVSIFATVYYELLTNANGRVGWVGLPSRNNFLYFLMHGMSATYIDYHRYMVLSAESHTLNKRNLAFPSTFNTSNSTVSAEYIAGAEAKKACARGYDLPTKKIKYTAERYNTADGNNFPVFSLYHAMGMRAHLPIVGVWEGIDLVKDLGVGDGVKTEFVIPDLEIESATVVVKVDGVEVASGFTKKDVPMVTKSSRSIRTPYGIPGAYDPSYYSDKSNIERTHISADGKYMVTMSVGTKAYRWHIYELNDEYMPVRELNYGSVYNAVDSAFSHDGKYMACCDSRYSKIEMRMRNAEDAYELVAVDALSTKQPYVRNNMHFSADSSYFFTAAELAPRLNLYTVLDGVFTRLASYPDEQASYIYASALSPDAKYTAVSYNMDGHRLDIYEKDVNDNNVLLQSPTEVMQYAVDMKFNADGQYLAVGTAAATTTGPRLHLYKLVDGLFVEQDSITHDDSVDGPVAYGVDALQWLGKYLIVGNGGSTSNPYGIRMFDTTDDTLEEITYGGDPKGQRYGVCSANINTLALTPDNKYTVPGIASSAETNYVYMYFYRIMNQTQIHFDTPPAQDAVISAEYHTNAIPKDDDHVLDITWEIQVG